MLLQPADPPAPAAPVNVSKLTQHGSDGGEKARLLEELRRRDAELVRLLPEAARLRADYVMLHDSFVRRVHELEARLLRCQLVPARIDESLRHRPLLPVQEAIAQAPHLRAELDQAAAEIEAETDAKAKAAAAATAAAEAAAVPPALAFLYDERTIPPGGKVVEVRVHGDCGEGMPLGDDVGRWTPQEVAPSQLPVPLAGGVIMGSNSFFLPSPHHRAGQIQDPRFPHVHYLPWPPPGAIPPSAGTRHWQG